MNEQPENIWKKPWRGWAKAFAWFGLVAAAAFVVVFGFGVLGGGNVRVVDSALAALVISIGLAATASLVVMFIRWLCCWRNFKRFLFGVACLLTLIGLAHVIENVRGHFAWKKVQQVAAAKGERFDLASIIPPPVPDAENFAMAPLFEGLRKEMDPEWRRAHVGPGGLTNENRFVLTPYRTNSSEGALKIGGWLTAERTDLNSWQRYYRDPNWDGLPDRTNGKAKVLGIGAPPAAPNPNATSPVVNEFPTSVQPQSPAADVLLALSKYDPVMEELREAARRPRSRFPVRYEDSFNALLPHLGRMKRASQFLALRAVAELDASQTEQALADVKLSFRLIDSMRGEANLISHLVRVAQIHLAVQPVWEGLADHRWNDAQLAALEAELARFDFFPDYLTAMRGERVCSVEAVDYVRRTRDWGIFGENSGESGSGSVKRSSGTLLMHLIPSGWFDQSRALMGRLHLELFLTGVDQVARTVSPTKVSQMGEALDKAFSHRTPYNVLAAMLMPALTRAVEKFARGQTCADLARVACALERHRLAHGSYPEALDALTPQFIAKLPHDVINGQPLKYRRTDDGQFVVYSVGWNEADDGGKVELTKKGGADWNRGDWVWRYPAK